jgi:hypothetical protein
MADEFDRFLASALAPPERLPDRNFVAGVRARITLEERLAGERRALLSGLIKQLVALVAVTAAVGIVARASPVAAFFAKTPALGLATLLVGFGFVVALFSTSAGSAVRRPGIS